MATLLTLILASAGGGEGPAARAQDPSVPWSEMEKFFVPPEEWRSKLGDHSSLMKFDDGTPVRTREDWSRRREEILKYWHGVMGAWPPLLERPRVKYLEKERLENFTRHKVEVEFASDRFSSTQYLLLPDGQGPFPAVLVTWYPRRIGIVGHSFGGKWAMFASCLHDRFACAVWVDPGIVWNEKDANANYWEKWYLGYRFDQPGDRQRRPGVPDGANPRTGAYKRLLEDGRDLNELHALMAPRPFLVSGGAQDRPEHWTALNHSIALNEFLGHTGRVAMTMRDGHTPTPESNAQVHAFFEHFLKGR